MENAIHADTYDINKGNGIHTVHTIINLKGVVSTQYIRY